MSRVKFIHQKRGALLSQLTRLETALAENELDKANATIRVARVKESFNAYEDLNEELAELDPNDASLGDFKGIEDRFYALATRISAMPSPGGSSANAGNHSIAPSFASSTFVERQQLLKLPRAALPKFGGEHDKWITFKNAFSTMVDARSDIDDVVKFMYLRDSLSEEPLNKISIYDVTAGNYKNAWQLLLDAYDRKRILVAKHLDALIDTAPLKIANAKDLSRLVDNTRQHLTVLTSLGVTPDDHMIVRILERALPIDIRQKWEESLGLDTFPQLDAFYKFISQTSFRLSTMEVETTRVQAEKGNKRPADGKSSVPKKGRNASPAQVYATATSAASTQPSAKCGYCEEAHRIYACSKYFNLPAVERWKFVESKGLCKNCLAAHKDACRAGTCRKCNESHHTSLHRAVLAQTIRD